MTGIIFDISQYMLEDGPGIRTNVFLKGCPLRCRWCSNAYGLEPYIQMAYDKNRCIGCGKCLPVCEKQAVKANAAGGPVIQDFNQCINCMKCVRVCPNHARTQIGRYADAREIFREIEKDRSFFRRGGGGITLSGGEILLQADFAEEILRLCEDNGIHTAIETSAFGSWENLERLITYTAFVFIDIKSMNSDQHKQLTCADNEGILENIRRAANLCEESGKTLILRFPLIPTLNDDDNNIKKTAEFVKQLPGTPLLNVLPYHNFGEPKYEKIGRKYATGNLKIQKKEDLMRVRALLNESGVRYSIGGYDT